ncbi:glutathione S-transferase N-terminal domain-containing protein [Sphingomonas sp.]|uniref:glutathione S-transferase family protein n=1 Tax=Sphingomonas sp. TaxID=28214 RepID=UPI001EBC7017|nr:glutathione S-transferase N-terminal domain-containing protein [Sphingomonas sp.]MBX3594654.1 glutathione S-transferase N-terminal domain-containing protein [Sphingomonas sp.]
MKLYDAPWAPSPRRVRIFLAEKGIDIPREVIDLRSGEQLGDAYLRINPRGAVPALLLDGGEVLCESAAICRYFEALHPDPALFGSTPLEIGRIESWTRRIEGDGYAACVYVLRNTAPAFRDRAIPDAGLTIAQIPELAARGAIMWESFVEALDARLADRPWIAGERYSFADITALVTIDFARAAKLAAAEHLVNLHRWHRDASARASADA